MQKRAYQRNKADYLTVYEPLPAPADAQIYRDRTTAILPYAEDFPKLHFHDRYEIGICETGEGLFLAEGEFFSVSAGDAVFLPPEKRHYSRSIDPKSPCIFRFAYILPAALRTTLASLTGTDADRVLSDAAYIPTVLRGEDTREIRAALSVESAYADAATLLHLCILLLQGAPNAPQAAHTRDRARSGEASELAAYLALHYSENESAQALAELYHLSESQMRRKFVAAYKLPPIAYRNALRCRIGAELLLRTDTSVSAISERLGFTASTDFYRLFRKQFGVSPTEFRKKGD